MVKKNISKKVVKKAMPKKSTKKSANKEKIVQKSISKNVNIENTLKKKMSIITKNLILFSVMFLFSVVLYITSSTEIYENLFILLSIMFGFLTITFLLIILISFFLRLFKK